VTSDERRATSDERRATSDERRATSGKRRAASGERQVQERYPELHALVSALLAGPVAVCDGAGDTDAVLTMRTAAADGTRCSRRRNSRV